MEDTRDIQINGFIKFLVEDRYRIIRHLIFLIGLFLLFYSSNSKLTSYSPQIYKFYMVLLGWSVFITMFYVNMYILVPFFFFKSRYLLYIILLIVLVTASLSFIGYIINNTFPVYKIDNTTFKLRQDKSLYNGIIISTPIILMTTTLKLLQRWIKDKERISELKNLSLSMELDVLKNQINPHFLFNMLNNIKALIRKNPEKATEILMKLSGFLRYQLYENNDKTTPLTLEINSLSNFLNFEELRRENFTAVINHNQDIQSFNHIFIPPNLFTTFVENAVKHSVDLTDNNTYITLDFAVENSKLIFTCRNSRSQDSPLESTKYSGLGLKNIKRRLELLYQDQYCLNIMSTETEYIVNLTIPLSMNCIIVDDEPLAREEMRSLINEISPVEILGEFSNALTALSFLKDNKTDLIFLDIQMPKVTGLEFAEMVPEETLIVFTTAYPQYALKSYELDAIDYLLKPIEKQRLKKAIDKASSYKDLFSQTTVKNTIEGSNDASLMIKADKRYYKIQLDDILFIEGLKDYVVIYTQNQKLITAMNLKTIHQKISSPLFLRVSKSYVVNMQHIESFDSHTIYIGEHEIPIGEVYGSDFFDKYSGGLIAGN